MEFPGQFHPQITHAPIVLIIVGAIFELIGRAVDLDWWRKAAFAMLIFGVLAAAGAVWSGNEAGEAAEKQHVPEAAIESHEDMGKLTLWLGLAAVIARFFAGRIRATRRVLPGVALVLHLAAAVVVGIAAHRGGMLIFQHGAGVHLSGAPAAAPAGEHEHDHD
jgi:uncharacterized membrane protein